MKSIEWSNTPLAGGTESIAFVCPRSRGQYIKLSVNRFQGGSMVGRWYWQAAISDSAVSGVVDDEDTARAIAERWAANGIAAIRAAAAHASASLSRKCTSAPPGYEGDPVITIMMPGEG